MTELLRCIRFVSNDLVLIALMTGLSAGGIGGYLAGRWVEGFTAKLRAEQEHRGNA